MGGVPISLNHLGLLLHIIIVVMVVIVASHSNLQYENVDNLGKAAKGRLYTLRSKLTKEGTPDGGKRVRVYSPVQYQSPRTVPVRKESSSRGYSFHHSSADVKNPMYHSVGYSSRDFHSRMGKVSPSEGIKWKSPDKRMDKYMKYAYKVDGGASPLNSFNIHQIEEKNGTEAGKGKKAVTMTTSSTTTTTTTQRPTTTSSIIPQSPFNLAGLNIAKLGQGLNSAMTSVLTQKLMGIIDQEIPQGFLVPLKHIVSSGEKMVEFWDKRKTGRDGEGKPGIVEVFGYGIEQLKRYRDGQNLISKEDPVANMTSASRAMIQGMMVIKKLTNRVLGYDTDERRNDLVESRGGYDHGGGWGWGHHMSYGHYLDPYAILATLGFGVFLFNVIFNLLNNAPAAAATGRSLDVADVDIPLALSDIMSGDKGNMEDVSGVRIGLGGLDPFALLAALAFGAFLLQLLLTILNTSARSIDVVDMNVPLLLSDYHVPNFMTKMDKIFGTPTVRTKRSAGEEDDSAPLFNSVVDKLEGMYRTYKTVTGNPSCAKLHLCRTAIQDAYSAGGDDSDSSIFSQLYTIGLGQLSGDPETLSLVKSIKSRVAKGEDVNCEVEMKGCEE